jgi:ribosomal protein L37AE/L43A
MDTVLLTSAAVGAFVGASAALVIIFMIPRKSCPACSSTLPRFRRPTSVHQAMLGGWTCNGCGAKVAGDGSLIKEALDDRRA